MASMIICMGLDDLCSVSWDQCMRVDEWHSIDMCTIQYSGVPYGMAGSPHACSQCRCVHGHDPRLETAVHRIVWRLLEGVGLEQHRRLRLPSCVRGTWDPSRSFVGAVTGHLKWILVTPNTTLCGDVHREAWDLDGLGARGCIGERRLWERWRGPMTDAGWCGARG